MPPSEVSSEILGRESCVQAGGTGHLAGAVFDAFHNLGVGQLPVEKVDV
jgi:hypothetical protein